MKIKSLFTEILSTVVHHEKQKVKTSKPDLYLNQKKQLWYGLMNQIDPEEPTAPASDSDGGNEADSPRSSS